MTKKKGDDSMKHVLLALYKVTWKHTAASYVAVHNCRDEKAIMNMLREHDDRCDDIVKIERVELPAFEDGVETDGIRRKTEYLDLYYDMWIF